jgi:hypothetical protein
MANVKIEDIFQATLWTTDIINQAPELQNILNSGLFRTNEELQKVVNAQSAGSKFELPYIDEPDYTEPTAMDDSDDLITPDKISWKNQFAVLGMYSRSFGYANIVQQITRDSDPAGKLRAILGNYWARDLQNRIISNISGIAEKAGSDLTLDVADDSDDGADVLISASIIIDGASLLGDMQDKFEFLFIHSKVYADMKKQNLIDVIPPSEEGAKPIEHYGNYRIIVNDKMPVIQGDNKKKYVSLIAQSGIFAYADKNLGGDMPVLETYRDPRAGKGAGTTQIISRKGFLLHPVGWSWSKAGMSPTLSDLSNKDNWTMKFKVKQQKFVRIITN